MKMLRMALIASLMTSVSLGTLLLPAAASHRDQERLPNGMLCEPVGPDAHGGTRT
jgi:hypothetical protein